MREQANRVNPLRYVIIDDDPSFLEAARALLEGSTLGAREIVERSLNIAAEICIYTNRNLIVEELSAPRGVKV